MKLFGIFCLILGLLALTGCNISGGLSKAELFEKKQECAVYSENIKEEAKNTLGEGRLIEVFYSTEQNSCFYYYISDEAKRKALVNFLTKEILMTASINLPENADQEAIERYTNEQQVFDQEMGKLKGE